MGWVLACYVVAGIGALAMRDAQGFYGQLNRPAWAPPGWVFGPVWTVLYGLMGVAAWMVWREGGVERRAGVLGLFLVQLALNGLWSWLFFAWQLGAASTAEIIVLWALIAVTTVRFWRVRALSGILMVPYLVWVTYAVALCWAIWKLNRGVL
jgi:tryptophan-rich sensory protein